MIAVIKIDNKQFLVKKNDIAILDHLNLNEGNILSIKNILLIKKHNKIFLGGKFLSDIRVLVRVIKNCKMLKCTILKKKKRKNYDVRTFFQAKKSIVHILGIKLVKNGD